MKLLMGLGRLPKNDPESCRAWLHGKLLTMRTDESVPFHTGSPGESHTLQRTPWMRRPRDDCASGEKL